MKTSLILLRRLDRSRRALETIFRTADDYSFIYGANSLMKNKLSKVSASKGMMLAGALRAGN